MSEYVVRPVRSTDAPALAMLLNSIIRAGGTTALENEFTAESLDAAYLTGPDVHCCHVAEDATGAIVAFQTLGAYPGLPADVGDIGTFAAVDRKQGGAGKALFAVTINRARELGLRAINATIRADNLGGLAFYSKQGFVDHSVTRAVPLSDGTPVDRLHKRFEL